MINDQLLGYVRQQLSLNVGKELITANLKSQGWTDMDIHEVFTAVAPFSTPTSVPISPAVSGVTPNFIQTQTAQTDFSNTTHTKGKKIFSIILILLLLGLIGGGAYAYYSGVFVSLPSLVSQAMSSTRSANTANYDFTVSADFSEVKSMISDIGQLFPVGISSNKIIVTTKGLFDVSDAKNIKNSTLISVDFGTLSFIAELRVLNNTLYGVLTKTPTVIALFLPTISSYENKWFSLPFNSENGQNMNNPISSLSGIDTTILDKITPEQEDHLYQMFRGAHFVKTVKRFAPETVGGELSYHFSFDLDREGIRSYLQSLKEYVNSIGKDDSSLSAFDPTSMDKSLDDLKDFIGEIWIGRNDKLIHKFVLNFGIQPDVTEAEQVKINMVGITSGWNQPVSIVAPVESVPLETIIAEIMSGSLGNAQQKGKEASIKSYMANLRAQAELFYDAHSNSYSGFCSSNELKTARKGIEDSGGTKFVCKDKAQAYALAVKLSPSSGYWCVDSTGASKSTTTLSSSTVCPGK